MFEKILFLASGTAIPADQTSIGKMFAQWQQVGFFAYIIPFLIIFALLYGILSKIKLFGDESKKVNAILSIAIALISIQFSFLTDFFAELFPRFGIAIAIILVAMLTMGLFFQEKHKNAMAYISLAIGVVVILSTFFALGWGADLEITQNVPAILLAVVFIGLIIWTLKGKGSKKEEKKPEKKE